MQREYELCEFNVKIQQRTDESGIDAMSICLFGNSSEFAWSHIGQEEGRVPNSFATFQTFQGNLRMNDGN